MYEGSVFWVKTQNNETPIISQEKSVGQPLYSLVDPRTTPRSAWVQPNVKLLSDGQPHPLGRLKALKEAAGKVRVIAIVDPITN